MQATHSSFFFFFFLFFFFSQQTCSSHDLCISNAETPAWLYL